MRPKLVLVALAVIIVAGVTTIALSGGSSKSAMVTATPEPTPKPSPKPSPGPTHSVSARPTPRLTPTHKPVVAPVPGPTHPTLHVAAPVPAACKLPAGVQTIAGRAVIVDLPTRFPAPLVIDFHGGNQSAAQEHGYTGLGPAGSAAGFVVVTPEGTGGLWNFPGTEPLPDDAAFTQTIATTLAGAGCSNGRVYTAGISDGADMAIAAACRVPAVRAAFAVAPSITPRGVCTRKSLVEVHGTADPVVPYTGSAGGSFGDTPSEPVASRLPFWTAGCSGPAAGPSPGAGTAVQVWTCTGGRVVVLDTVNGGGHTWPGAVGNEPVGGLGARAAWSADAAALAFFASH